MPPEVLRSLIAIIMASEKHDYSALRLYEAATRRSGFQPLLVRRLGTMVSYGLFQFQRTQWEETLLSMGKKITEVHALDILDPYVQADAAAFLFVRNRVIRGD